MLDAVLEWLGYGLCHQLPERSLFGGGLQYPVCARDTGIYLGFLVAFLVLAWIGRRKRPAELPPLWAWLVIGGFIGAMALDGATSYAGLRDTTNDLRLITGLMAGFAIGALVVSLLNGQAWRRPGRERVLQRPLEALAWLAGLPVAFVVIRFAGPLTGALLPLLTGASIVFTFMMVNLVIVVLIPPFERAADRWWELRVPILIALVMTLIEVWLSVVARQGILELAARVGGTS